MCVHNYVHSVMWNMCIVCVCAVRYVRGVCSDARRDSVCMCVCGMYGVCVVCVYGVYGVCVVYAARPGATFSLGCLSTL
jgi:hypothetical protein